MAETENDVIRELAEEAAAPLVAEPGRLYAWHRGDGSVDRLDLTGCMPARRQGTVAVRDVAAFAGYFSKHADESSEVFADLDAARVTAVLDAHRSAEDDDGEPESAARWQQHRLVLRLVKTKAWETWTGSDRQMMPQVTFAEFLEDNYRDLAPEGKVRGAEFLEIAQSFQASTRTEFESGTRLATGDIELTLKEQTTASAGRQKKIPIPQVFELAIVPYEDCAPAVISARFRYRAAPGGLLLGYFLDSPDRHAEEAVRQVTEMASAAIGRDIWLGTPAA